MEVVEGKGVVEKLADVVSESLREVEEVAKECVILRVAMVT